MSVRQLLGRAWFGFVGVWAEADPGAQRRAFAWLFGGLLVAAAVSGASALVLSAVWGDGPLPGDAALAAWIDERVSIRMAAAVSTWGASVMLVPVVTAAVLAATLAGRGERALSLAVAFVGSKVVTQVGWALWDRARPGSDSVQALLPAHPSYPSGHVVQATVVYGLLTVWAATWTRSRAERVVLVLVWLTVVLASVAGRVRLGAHHPTDTLAAVVLGCLWLGFVVLAERAFRTSRPSPPR